MEYDETENQWILRRKVPVRSSNPFVMVCLADTVMAIFLTLLPLCLGMYL